MKQQTGETQMLRIIIAVLTLLFSSAVFAQTPPAEKDFVKNSKYVENAAPAADAPLNLTESQKKVAQDMENVKATVIKLCGQKKKVWMIDPVHSLLEVTAFKNLNLPVKGKFEHFSGYVVENPGKSTAALWVDATSYNSGVAQRDHRVIQYLLDATEPKNAVARLDLRQKGEKTVGGKLHFRGKSHTVTADVTVKQDATSLHIQSANPVRLDAKIPKGDFLKLMELCNHESMAKMVDLSFDLALQPACK